jgi:hypothetical protein
MKEINYYFDIDSTESIADTALWMGGTDLGSEGNFYWATTNEPFNYTYWLSGQPDNMNENHHCLVFNTKMSTGETGWADNPCWAKNTSYNFRFLCESFSTA